MKTAALVAGILLLVIGALVTFDVINFTEDKEVLKIGGLEASVERERNVPQGLGIGAMVVGGVLVLVGVMRKR